MKEVIILNAFLFACFLLFFLTPRRRRDWLSFGIAEAFFLSFLFEMYGFAFTVYVLNSCFGIVVSGGSPIYELLGFSPVLKEILKWVGVSLVSIGGSLVFLGWGEIYRGKGDLVTRGPYGYSRHPQYVGLILIATGLLVFWPNLLTIVMWPIIVVSYYRLAKSEETKLLEKFGVRYERYMRKVPMFIGWKRAMTKITSEKSIDPCLSLVHQACNILPEIGI